MKSFSYSLIIIFSLLLISGCNGKGGAKKESHEGNDTTSVPDTGFTGIKQFMSGRFIVSEVTFKNGVPDGLKKTFYASGKLRQTFWYVNGLRQDSSRWYYEEGQLFRTTPYKNDTIDGTQKQYYRTGQLKAKLFYKKGFRTPELEEYTKEGKLLDSYPQLVVTTNDEYRSKGLYRITLELSNKATRVRYYRGEFANGVFDTTRCQRIKTVDGIGHLDLKKTGSPKSGYVGVIAEILTTFGNNYLSYKKIDLPYKDLN